MNGSLDFNRVESDSGQRDGNGNQLHQKALQEEALQRLKTLYSLLHGLQGVVAHQDSLLELQLHEAGERRERLSRTNSRKEAPAPPAATSPSADWQATDLSLLQKQHSLLQEELSHCRQLCQEKAQEAAVLEARLRESEQERVRQEQLAEEARKQLAAQRQTGEAWARKNAEPRRRSLPAGDALYQSFTPPQGRGGEPLSPGCHSLHRTFVGCQRDDLGYHGLPGRLQEGDPDLDTLSEEEGVVSQQSPPSSPRDFQRMQDIPEEIESSQDPNAGEDGSPDS